MQENKEHKCFVKKHWNKIVIIIIILGSLWSIAHFIMREGIENEYQEHHRILGKDTDKTSMINRLKNNGNKFSQSVENLPEVKKSEIVDLKDGDVYEMEAYAVKQEVGNRTVKRLSYNGMIPGPILKVKKGAKITLRFKNSLEIPTTLHSHGLRLDDSKYDGLPTTMGGEQKPMQPGEIFEYKLNFPDTGVYWYHPHIREDYTQEMGLYGNYSVTEDGYWSKVDGEEFIILDDFSEDNIFYKDKVDHTMMGRYGDIMMINNDENYTLTLNQYETKRFFVTNVANTRTFDFEIEKDAKKQNLKMVGGDAGRVEKEYLTDNFIIAPAERYIFEARFDEAGEYTIKSKNRVLGKIIVKKASIEKKPKLFGKNLRTNTEDYKIIRDNFDKFVNKKADKKLKLTIAMKGVGPRGGAQEMRRGMDHKDGKGNMMGGKLDDLMKKEREIGGNPNVEHDGEKIEWEENMEMMNKMSNDQMMEWEMVDETDSKNIKKNMDINWSFKKGDFIKVEIYNDQKSMHPMQHPIHFHGQRFIILKRDGKVNKNLQWKDTTLVKTGEKIEILIQMTNPGVWMSHCHIAEHLQSGMMMTFKVK